MGQKNSVKVFRNSTNYSKKHKVNLCLKSCKSRNMDIKWRLGTVWYEAKRISIQVQQDQCIGKSIFFVLVPSVWHRFLTPETPAKEIFAWETFWYIHQAPGSKKQRCIPSTNWVGRVELWLSSKWTERKTEIRLENRSINKAGHSSEKWRKTCKQTKQGLIILLLQFFKSRNVKCWKKMHFLFHECVTFDIFTLQPPHHFIHQDF